MESWINNTYVVVRIFASFDCLGDCLLSTLRFTSVRYSPKLDQIANCEILSSSVVI
jgi:hypothetical protein